MTGLRHTGGPLGQPEECGSTTGGALLEEILRPKSILQKLDTRCRLGPGGSAGSTLLSPP